jgi:MFS transporter, putative metabolite:H+ symporter
MLWYSVATVIMAFMPTGNLVCLMRFIAGIGIGVELVTIDTFVAELIPKHLRGRAFAVNQMVQFSVVPLVALLAYLLVPLTPFGLDGWRWVALIGSAGAVAVWILRSGLPESPRWLINQGRVVEAERVVSGIEAKIVADLGGQPLPAAARHAEEKLEPMGSFSEIWEAPYGRRTTMLAVFQFFQTFGFYGFAAWVPTLIARQTGINLSASLLYSFIIAIANPFGPMLAILFADKVERKWQLVGAAIGIGVFGMIFSQQTAMVPLIVLGVLITLANNILSYSFHGYQTELFPTRIRARAVGFTYSFSRISTVFAAFIIGWFLNNAGSEGVFGLIAFAMLVVVISIGGFGPKTQNLELEQISH